MHPAGPLRVRCSDELEVRDVDLIDPDDFILPDGERLPMETFLAEIRQAGIDGVKAALLHEVLGREALADMARVAATLKALPLRLIARHVLGLYQGQPGARQWRRMLSDAKLLKDADFGLIEQALASVAASRRYKEPPCD